MHLTTVHFSSKLAAYIPWYNNTSTQQTVYETNMILLSHHKIANPLFRLTNLHVGYFERQKTLLLYYVYRNYFITKLNASSTDIGLLTILSN